MNRGTVPTVSAHPAAKPVAACGIKILYAEDNAMIRNHAAALLRRAGYAVTPAQDGLEAWEALSRESYDLLITDNEMPRLSGSELVTKVRLAGHDLLIIAASGSAPLFTMAQPEPLRPDILLQKPFCAEELLASVEQVLSLPVEDRREPAIDPHT